MLQLFDERVSCPQDVYTSEFDRFVASALFIKDILVLFISD